VDSKTYEFSGPAQEKLSLAEAAAWLGIKAATITALLKRGWFPRPHKLTRKEPAYWYAHELAAARPILSRLRPYGAKKKNGAGRPRKNSRESGGSPG
jgi:predicted DNA-binding transcriptional regulator AlpA